MDNFEYNTQNPDVILKEYGRNIQKLVEYIVKIEDEEKRNRFANNLIELMRQINPNTRDSQDTQNKLWDDLYIMSRFNLQVESPYPMPDKESIGKKPKRMDYSSNEVAFRHYGRNIELMISKIDELEDPEDRFGAYVRVSKLMKSFYLTWNKDSVQDIVIIQHLEKISKKAIDPEIRKRLLEENWLELSSKEKKGSSHHHHHQNRSKKKKKR